MTFDELRAIFSYDPETGVIERITRLHPSVPLGICTHRDGSGYLDVYYRKRRIRAHRLAWLLFHGEWPKGDIDHINGIPTDNRLCNLRVATPSQNQANTGLRKDNKTGFKGVGFEKKSGKFTAKIKLRGVRTHLGNFATAELAHEAYAAAANAMRGEFARLK